MSTAAIIGTGLIGTSVGLALRASGWFVTGWDPDQSAIQAALDLEAIDAQADGLNGAIDQADLVVLAGPPGAVVADLAGLATDALVTDVAGVKVPVVQAAAHLPHFVGGHPMAGREHAGPRAASAALFRGATWILCSDGASEGDQKKMTDIVMSFGAVPVTMTAAEHDAAVAAISHLPQVLASVLVQVAAGDPHALDLAAGSFRDLTRVALSEPAWWAELLVINRDELQRVLGSLIETLSLWSSDLEEGAVERLAAHLRESRDLRRAMAPPVVAVGVVMQDRPGELGAVGRALAVSGVDVRDLQLRHGPHGGGGVLTLSVRPGESETLRAALVDEGFVLEE
ncbi:MAG: prephenate dehydrogenase [Acidimicrobiia bacterium]